MGKRLKDLRPVYVVGVGIDRYRKLTRRTFVELGLNALRAALSDAGIGWRDVESVYHGTVLLGSAPTRVMVRHLGGTGIAITQVENASASGSSAFRLACLEVASGISEISLALGVDKPDIPRTALTKTGIHDLVGMRVMPVTHFALQAREYMERCSVRPEQIAAVAVKNHGNGARNPFAHRQKARTMEEVLAGPPISGILTRLQCCPIGEGAAAAIVASEAALRRSGMDASRAVRVLASVSRSERLYEGQKEAGVELTRETAAQALEQAGVSPDDLHVVELHDAFSIEEVLYAEAMGLCGEGEAAARIAKGEFHLGGKCAISPSGGLLAMGHPIGPTGIGQIAEIVRQLRGEAGARQQPKARMGLAHMVGVGTVCLVHILERRDKRVASP